MFHYFSNQNLSERNGVSATISMGNWFLLMLLGLVTIIPVIGVIVYLVLYIMLGVKKTTAPSLANYIKLYLIFAAIMSVFVIIIFVIGGIGAAILTQF